MKPETQEPVRGGVTRLLEFLTIAMTIVILIGVAVSTLGPGGSLAARITRWREEWSQRRVVRGAWGNLVRGEHLDSAGAAVSVVEFGDYQCQYCRTFAARLRAFLSQHPDIGVVYRHLPLGGIHPLAFPAATASVCAASQGRFREMHDLLYADPTWQEAADWRSYAQRAGIADLDAFATCLRSDSASAVVREDQALAATLGLKGTPTFVLQDRVVKGVLDLDALTGSNRRR